jgi:polysaccharide pyruvyl transferase WcaK-like protein
MSDIGARRPALASGAVVAHRASSLGELLEEIEPVGFVVGARYHNVISGLRLSKPTISVGYSLKHDLLMSDMGVPEFALSARSVSANQLIDRFVELEGRSSEVRGTLERHLRCTHRKTEDQFEDLAVLINAADASSRSRSAATRNSAPAVEWSAAP